MADPTLDPWGSHSQAQPDPDQGQPLSTAAIGIGKALENVREGAQQFRAGMGTRRPPLFAGETQAVVQQTALPPLTREQQALCDFLEALYLTTINSARAIRSVDPGGHVMIDAKLRQVYSAQVEIMTEITGLYGNNFYADNLPPPGNRPVIRGQSYRQQEEPERS